MSGYAKRLHGKDRLHRIVRIRTLTLGSLGGVTALFILAGFAAQGASLKPLFVPLAGAIEIGLLMAVVATALAAYFRHLEITHAAGDSHRFLLAREGMVRAGWAAGVAFGIGVLLFLPTGAQVAGDLLSDAPLSVPVPGFETRFMNFTSPDTLGLSFVRQIVVTGQPSSTGNVLVTVTRDGQGVASGWVNGSGDRFVASPIPEAAPRFASWSIAMENTLGGRAEVAVGLQKGAMPGLFTVVPFLLILLGGVNVAWRFVARPIRDRTKAAAVFAGGVETKASQDERFYVEYATTAARARTQEEARPSHPAKASVVQTPAIVAAPSRPPEPAPRPTEVAKVPAKPATPRPKVDTPDALVGRAEALAGGGQLEAALASYDEALRMKPAHVPALLGRAAGLERLGKKAESIDAYRRVLVADRRNDKALAALGSLLMGERRWREALEAVDETLRLRAHDGTALERKGDILTNLGRRTEALGAYNEAYDLDPSDDGLAQKIEEARVDVPGLLSRALIASASGKYAQALRLFDDILEIDPSNVNALIGKAVAYRRSGQSMRAINCLDLVLSIQPNNVAALLNRGHILQAEGDLDGALEAFDTLVSLSSLDDEAWAAQGDVLAKMGRDDDALRAYAEALKLNPGDELIHAKVRELEESRAMTADVLQEISKVKGIGPSRAKALSDAGFKTAEHFEFATVEELTRVKGITPKIAEDLIDHFQRIAPAVR